MQTEEDTAFHKPDPGVFELALFWLAQEGIQPHEVLYVGDHLNDMIAAQGSGIKFIGVGTGLISIEKFQEYQVKGIDQLLDLLDVLRLHHA